MSSPFASAVAGAIPQFFVRQRRTKSASSGPSLHSSGGDKGSSHVVAPLKTPFATSPMPVANACASASGHALAITYPSGVAPLVVARVRARVGIEEGREESL